MHASHHRHSQLAVNALDLSFSKQEQKGRLFKSNIVEILSNVLSYAR